MSQFWHDRAVSVATELVRAITAGSRRGDIYRLAVRLKEEIASDQPLQEMDGVFVGIRSGSALIECIDQGEQMAVESTYRRGYVQGYDAAVEDMQDGATEHDMCEHTGRLMDWREGDRSRVTLPPRMPQPSKA